MRWSPVSVNPYKDLGLRRSQNVWVNQPPPLPLLSSPPLITHTHLAPLGLDPSGYQTHSAGAEDEGREVSLLGGLFGSGREVGFAGVQHLFVRCQHCKTSVQVTGVEVRLIPVSLCLQPQHSHTLQYIPLCLHFAVDKAYVCVPMPSATVFPHTAVHTPMSSFCC